MPAGLGNVVEIAAHRTITDRLFRWARVKLNGRESIRHVGNHTAWTGMLVFVLLAALETNTDCDFVRHLHLS